MTTTLARHPLRTSLSMTFGHEEAAPLPADDPSRPFAYAFATWTCEDAEEAQDDTGHYNEETQVWEIPGGGYTMGVYTKTRTGCSCHPDYVTDDACF
ncbi:hypothetical protein [Catelliglobosispora koreensis]|uniref:hypothetical protein n=1 Tax=Catelliglobosispora koreensis TaxID=129052 RepID=UPI001FE00792|nr:hypothetical protein [Catelliglobosispora koreensis]